ncbi:MAG TPA: glutathione peroxidase [Pirellulaceae bacterium]|nr:glutathione peroxidase [Pirellulaceae bacterium]
MKALNIGMLMIALAIGIQGNPAVAQSGESEAVENAESKDVPAALNFTMKSLDGEDIKLSDYQGKVILVVNVASKCGLTPQYEGLQELFSNHAKDGLVVLGFPCDQFRNQEFATDGEIKQFCSTKYGVEFPMFSKVKVNGDDQCGLYKYLTNLDLKPVGKGNISWNFEKFLIARDGQVVARFSPRTSPQDEELIKAIKEELAKSTDN